MKRGSTRGTTGTGTVRLRDTRFDYVERGLFAGSVSTSSFLAPLWGATLDLRFNYSRADRDEPDRREYTYEEAVVNGQPVWRQTLRIDRLLS